jgi:hypothetical protein
MKTNKLSQTANVFLALLFCVLGIIAVKAQPLTGTGVDPNAQLLMDFENGSIAGWLAGNAGRGEVTSVELMDAEQGDPVRFGRYAIKFNCDFTKAQTEQTLGAYFAPPVGSFVIPAAPNGTAPNNRKIGMWIYISPEIRGNLWFRMQLFNPPGAAPSGASVVSVFGNEPSYGNLAWDGWKYHTFDFPDNAANKELGPPASVSVSYAMFRIMMELTRNPADGSKLTKGYFIIDNVRVTTTAEDMTPPVITSLTGNGTNLTGTYNTSAINLSAGFNDNHANSSGLNYSSIQMFVDGLSFKSGDSGFSVDEETNTVSLTGMSLSNGTHNVTVHVEDNFGHITTKTGAFIVNASDGPTTIVSLDPDAEAYVGNTFEMKINTDNPKDVKELELVIELNNVCSIEETGGVVFAESAQGSDYDFNSRLGILRINLKNDINADAVETLATIKVNIPKNTLPNDVVRCSPVTAKAVFADNSVSLFTLFNAFTKDILAAYDVLATKRIVGMPGEVLVTDKNGNPQSVVTVYVLNEAMTTVITQAVTGADGIASAMNFTDTQQSIYIYAEKDLNYSHTRLIRTLPPLLTPSPTYVRSGTTVDPTSSKTFTWMSNPVTSAEPALIKFAKKSDGEGNFQQYDGTVKMLEFNGIASLGVTKGSAVTVEGLEPGTTYIYQVGDGTTWSPTREFITTTTTDKFSFGAFGDLQATGTGGMNRWIAAAQTMESMTERPFFSLNVGDINDNDDRFDYHSYYGYLFNQRPIYANIDMISSYGNHEYMGSATAENNNFMFGHPTIVPSPSYNSQLLGYSYAVEYGNMIVISLDWEARGPASDNATMTEQARWMDEILTANPDKVWKIVTLHYPIFPNASTSGSQAIYGPIFDKHNVQLVFCGHGHTYERVQAKNGSVTSGSNRRTFQPVTDNGTLHIQLGDMTSTGDQARWLLCEVDDGKMTVTSRDANNNVVPAECFTLFASSKYTSIENAPALNPKIYPNPFEDVLYISGAENSTLRVMNILGTVVNIQKITGTNEIICLKQLSAGMYFFCIEKDGLTKTIKVVKK